jgi:HSP20 family protein
MSEDAVMQKEKSQPSLRSEAAYVPRADILENADHFTVVADMPGVDEKSVEATVQNRVLTIEGWTQPNVPEGHRALGLEFGGGRFRRDFSLPDAVDSERIQARVKNGVLTVSIPKKDEVKARKIQITG